MTTPQPQERQIQLRIDESKMNTTYANTIRTSTMPDELVMDFGINMPMPTQDGQGVLLFSVGSRVIMNWGAAKRLAISLGQAVRQYEEQHGEIKLPAGGQQGGAGGGPRLAT
jgi:hypothetical protein